MDKLPAEIISLIVSFLPETGLASFATISTKWTSAVEKYTFSRLALKSDGHDVSDFARLVTFQRRGYLKTLAFTVVVSFNELDIQQQSEQQARFSEAYTTAIPHIFAALASSDRGDMTLELGYITSARDWQDDIEPPHLRQRIELIHEGLQLAVVNCVSSLVLQIDLAGRRLAMRTVVELSKMMPHLKRINLITAHSAAAIMTGAIETLHGADRNDLTSAIAGPGFLSAIKCRELSLLTEDSEPFIFRKHLRYAFPDCTRQLQYDSLSSSLRTWSHILVRLNICGVFDGSLFWPDQPEGNPMPEFPWPKLRALNVEMGLPTPSGQWYFTVRRGTRYRNTPCDDTLAPLFRAWAKALVRMPVIETAAVMFRVELEYGGFTSPERWGVRFQAARGFFIKTPGRGGRQG